MHRASSLSFSLTLVKTRKKASANFNIGWNTTFQAWWTINFKSLQNKCSHALLTHLNPLSRITTPRQRNDDEPCKVGCNFAKYQQVERARFLFQIYWIFQIGGHREGTICCTMCKGHNHLIAYSHNRVLEKRLGKHWLSDLLIDPKSWGIVQSNRATRKFKNSLTANFFHVTYCNPSGVYYALLIRTAMNHCVIGKWTDVDSGWLAVETRVYLKIRSINWWAGCKEVGDRDFISEAELIIPADE